MHSIVLVLLEVAIGHPNVEMRSIDLHDFPPKKDPPASQSTRSQASSETSSDKLEGALSDTKYQALSWKMTSASHPDPILR